MDWGVTVNANLMHGFYLGDLLVEPLKGQINGPAGSAHLPSKATEVLLQLASQPGVLVTRDSLLTSVWGDGQGNQESLSHAISEIRHALNDHAEDPHFIQTLPKRGYRLIIEPQAVDEQKSSIVPGMWSGSEGAQVGIIENLKQRGVLGTALAYLILGWLLIQIADVVFDQLQFPQVIGTFVTVLVIVGFPIALALSWYLEFRDGRAILDDGPNTRSKRQRFSRTYLSVIGALALASVGVLIYEQFIGLPVGNERGNSEPIESENIRPIEANSIAVLRFLNIDGSDKTEIFASGFADDVTNKLARVPSLLVSPCAVIKIPQRRINDVQIRVGYDRGPTCPLGQINETCVSLQFEAAHVCVAQSCVRGRVFGIDLK